MNKPFKTYSPMHIMLANDGSEHTIVAAKMIHDIPLPEGSRISVVGVREPRMNQSRMALAETAEEVKKILEAKGVDVRSGILHGHPATALITYANLISPDLIVIGAKGLHAKLGGNLLGGVAQQVVEHAHWPVLVVKTPYRKIHRVLLATDGSPYCQLAEEYLANFPLPKDTEITILNVLPTMPASEYLIDSPALVKDEVHNPPDDLEKKQAELEEKEGDCILCDAAKLFEDSKFKVKTVIRRGEAAWEILDYAKANDIDLIVAGSRGLSAVKGWLMGSVSRKVVYHSDSSVLIVRGRPDNED